MAVMSHRIGGRKVDRCPSVLDPDFIGSRRGGKPLPSLDLGFLERRGGGSAVGGGWAKNYPLTWVGNRLLIYLERIRECLIIAARSEAGGGGLTDF